MSRLMSKETALTAAWIVALGSSLAVLYIGEVLGRLRAICVGFSALSCFR